MKALFFLFNIEGYGEFFSGITPFKTIILSYPPLIRNIKTIILSYLPMLKMSEIIFWNSMNILIYEMI